MRPDSIGPRPISQPYLHEPLEEEEIDQKGADLALVSDTTSLPKAGANPQKPTVTAATVWALLHAHREE